jgi:hypothetical protein
MPSKRLLAHYKIDPQTNRLLMVACNAEDMLLPRANFTFYGLAIIPPPKFLLMIITSVLARSLT